LVNHEHFDNLKQGVEEWIIWREEDADIHDRTTWRLLRCPACLRPTLEEIYELEGDPFPEEKILYPSFPQANLISTNLPHEIAQEYEAALKVRDISDNACAVLIRRTLEVICRHENAKGKDLFIQIQVLATSGHIPQPLADMAHLLRKIGNLGAHADEDFITKSDVTTMIDFLEAILEYLYVAPAKISAVQKRLKKTP
jgi:hypothetical protein